jgi:hypothetical protein
LYKIYKKTASNYYYTSIASYKINRNPTPANPPERCVQPQAAKSAVAALMGAAVFPTLFVSWITPCSIPSLLKTMAR